MKAGLPSNTGRPALVGPGHLERIDLNPYREGRRLQMLIFEMARDLTRDHRAQPQCSAPAHALFPQLAAIVGRYISEKVHPVEPARDVDVFLSPWYGGLVERLLAAINPADENGEAGEAPCYETGRGPGATADVDFETRRDPYPVMKSHVDAVVPDTAKWEQSTAYRLDTKELVHSFVKNAGLGFAIPYLHNGEPHEYLPDFIVRLAGDRERYLILETKGYDPLAEVKSQAAHRWVRAVNADGSFGTWGYAMVSDVSTVGEAVIRAAKSAGADTSAEGARSPKPRALRNDKSDAVDKGIRFRDWIILGLSPKKRYEVQGKKALVSDHLPVTDWSVQMQSSRIAVHHCPAPGSDWSRQIVRDQPETPRRSSNGDRTCCL